VQESGIFVNITFKIHIIHQEQKKENRLGLNLACYFLVQILESVKNNSSKGKDADRKAKFTASSF